MKTFLNWLVKSSANPEEVSATVKGILLTWVATIIFVGQAFHLQITQEWLVTVIQTTTATLGTVLTTVGLVRKLYYTFIKKSFSPNIGTTYQPTLSPNDGTPQG